jgi:signal recognition particle receptor subunit beta
VIVATAGHVDHGKTLLIRALTGVDTDRLPEERARGMTIDLGFAYLPLPAADGAAAPVLGFIDVPGHERFVRNMLAGVAGIDFALLVVAADDGPMPQTREHLAILDLLGIARGAVALTKTDRVDGARVAAVAAELRALLAPTALAAIPIVPTCAPRGEGIDTLQELLRGAQAALGARAASSPAPSIPARPRPATRSSLPRAAPACAYAAFTRRTASPNVPAPGNAAVSTLPVSTCAGTRFIAATGWSVRRLRTVRNDSASNCASLRRKQRSCATARRCTCTSAPPISARA